jgi:hypothetical protein
MYMKKFIKDIFKFSLSLTVFISIISIINYRFTYSDDYFNLPTNKKFLIVGDSHVEFAFDDSKNNFVNLGQSGELYLYTYHKVKKVLENNKQIKAVFIDFCNSQISKDQDTFLWSNESYLTTRYPIYSPLLDFEDYKLIWFNNPRGLINAHFKSLFKASFRVVTNNNITENNFMGGHQNLTNVLSDSILKLRLKVDNSNPQKKFQLSNLNLDNLERTVKLCEAHDVKVFFVRCPVHPKWSFLSDEQSFNTLRQSRFSKVDFLDFKNFPVNNDEFADLEHLNYKGSIKFSSFFNGLVDEKLLDKFNKQIFIDKELSNL